jgi:hypothetical protein
MAIATTRSWRRLDALIASLAQRRCLIIERLAKFRSSSPSPSPRRKINPNDHLVK